MSSSRQASHTIFLNSITLFVSILSIISLTSLVVLSLYLFYNLQFVVLSRLNIVCIFHAWKSVLLQIVLSNCIFFVTFFFRHEFAIASSDKMVYIRKFHTAGHHMSLMNTLQGHEGEVTSVKWSNVCNKWVTGSEDGTVRIWVRLCFW